jgi:hypothetical protein
MTIATGAPQVIAMRVARMAAHGMNPSASDRREMHRMVAEKKSAFGESWIAMGMQAMRMQQALWQSMWRPFMQPWWLTPMRGFTWPTTPGAAMTAWTRPARSHQAALASTMGRGLAQVAAAGLAPVGRRVRGNVKRLGAKRR